jgi:acid stress-induced BolA-like protein IbaG/YrbA
MRIEEIKNLIEISIPGSKAFVSTPDNVHFEAEVISPAFKNLSRIQQQRRVYECLDQYIKSGEIHALSLKTKSE